MAGARAKIHFAIVPALVPNGTFVTKCCGSYDASYAIARREQRFLGRVLTDPGVGEGRW